MTFMLGCISHLTKLQPPPQTVSGCIRKQFWSFFTSHVPAFIMAILSLVSGLQASEAHGVQYFGGFLLPHKEECVLLTHILGEYLSNT